MMMMMMIMNMNIIIIRMMMLWRWWWWWWWWWWWLWLLLLEWWYYDDVGDDDCDDDGDGDDDDHHHHCILAGCHSNRMLMVDDADLLVLAGHSGWGKTTHTVKGQPSHALKHQWWMCSSTSSFPKYLICYAYQFIFFLHTCMRVGRFSSMSCLVILILADHLGHPLLNCRPLLRFHTGLHV